MAKETTTTMLPFPWNYAVVAISGITCWFAGWPLANCILVVVSCGPHAYLAEGVRVINSHKGILSNGQQLNQGLNFGITLLMFFFVVCIVFNVLTAMRRRFARST